MKKHRGRDPEAIVTATAESMLVEAGQHAFPVDVEGIASLLGIKRRIGEYSFAGRIYAEPNGQLIMDLSGNDSAPRRRFTCGHEITHTVFPGFTREARYRIDPTVGSHSPERNEEEYLCDVGAAELLLPRALVRGDFDINRGLDEIEQLSDVAGASLEASANRLVDTSEDPVGLLVLEMSHKPADRAALRKGEDVPKRLRVRYAKCKGMSVYIPKFKSVDEDSVYSDALATMGVVKGEGHLPGERRARSFAIEAKRYDRSGKGGITERVLAIVRPF